MQKLNIKQIVVVLDRFLHSISLLFYYFTSFSFNPFPNRMGSSMITLMCQFLKGKKNNNETWWYGLLYDPYSGDMVTLTCGI